MKESRYNIINYPWLDTFLKSMPGSSSDFKEEWGWNRYLLADKMFAAILLISIISLILIKVVDILKKRVMPWTNILERN